MGALALSGCHPLPRPNYLDEAPPSYWAGVRFDNAGYKLGSQGSRLDTESRRIGVIEVPNEDDQSNSVVGQPHQWHRQDRKGERPASLHANPKARVAAKKREPTKQACVG
jgi:hypothetical protein